MDFLETLKSVGGVKPCPLNASDHQFDSHCPSCHGTGRVLYLAPLLAKPTLLAGPITDLLRKLADEDTFKDTAFSFPYTYKVVQELGESLKNPHVVGPRRASNLVYEIAHQLGGTAVVAEPVQGIKVSDETDRDQIMRTGHYKYEIITKGYRLSLPIPPDATVLFVTDRVDEHELRGMASDAFRGVTVLPYLLALVSTPTSTQILPNTELKIISLHQEKAS